MARCPRGLWCASPSARPGGKHRTGGTIFVIDLQIDEIDMVEVAVAVVEHLKMNLIESGKIHVRCKVQGNALKSIFPRGQL